MTWPKRLRDLPAGEQDRFDDVSNRKSFPRIGKTRTAATLLLLGDGVTLATADDSKQSAPFNNVRFGDFERPINRGKLAGDRLTGPADACCSRVRSSAESSLSGRETATAWRARIASFNGRNPSCAANRINKSLLPGCTSKTNPLRSNTEGHALNSPESDRSLRLFPLFKRAESGGAHRPFNIPNCSRVCPEVWQILLNIVDRLFSGDRWVRHDPPDHEHLQEWGNQDFWACHSAGGCDGTEGSAATLLATGLPSPVTGSYRRRGSRSTCSQILLFWSPFGRDLQRPDLAVERPRMSAEDPNFVLKDESRVFMPRFPNRIGLQLGPALAVF
jgi:hypothetical protein